MSDFDFYVHGVPTGHEVVGSNDKCNYYLKFYQSTKNSIKENKCLFIEIQDSKSYYTYLCSDKVQNIDGREGSYFAITLSFENKICTNVKFLYDLLDSIFDKICVNSFVHKANGVIRYKITSLNEAVYGGVKAFEAVKLGIQKNFSNLHFSILENGKGAKKVNYKLSLMDVDSPLFFDLLNNYSLTILPHLLSFKELYEGKCGEILPLQKEKQELNEKCYRYSKDVDDLKAKCLSRDKTIELQSHKLSEVEKKIENTEKEIAKRVKDIKEENEQLKAKVKNIGASAKEVEDSTQELMRQLAGRFPEVSEEDDNKDCPNVRSGWKKSTSILWLQIFNTLLLCAFIGGGAYLYYRTSDNSPLNSKLENILLEVNKLQPSSKVVEEPNKLLINDNERDLRFKLDDYRISVSGINVRGYNGKGDLTPNTKYTLQLKWKQGKEVLPDNGKWVCQNEAVNIEGNEMYVDAEKLQEERTKFTVSYIIEGSVIKERELTVYKP